MLRLLHRLPKPTLLTPKMSDPPPDLSSMGFTSFGKPPKHHQISPIHANPTPFPPSSSLPPRPPQNQPHRGRGNHRVGNFNTRGGPHRRNFHSNQSSRGGGGRGNRHHHPYPQHNHPNNNQQQQQDFTTTSTPAYRSKQFGEGLYKPSMIEDPWAVLTKKSQSSQSLPAVAAATTGDIWMGGQNTEHNEDKSNWYDKPEDKAADGGGWNADEIDLGD
ncbi:hypothetical protein TWF506_005718 [Arthrobotrys conoides]|uniref:Uncharacterized protein n=1 Tax=Arthrobotrys conoides TaxID=74498 RepID=A0AAN8NEP2_9PEZI